MSQSTSSICNNCSGNFEHTPLHMFYECENVKELFQWLLRILYNISRFIPRSNIRFIYFDTNYANHFQKSICNVFLYIYIITLWKNRKENLRIGILKKIIIRKVVEHLKFIKFMPNHKFEEIFDELTRLDLEELIHL